MGKKRKQAMDFILPMAFGLLVFMMWEIGGLHFILRLKPYQLPVPSQIFQAFTANLYALWKNGLFTLTEALAGLIIGSIAGFLVAVTATLFPKWGYFGLVLISAFNAIPIIAMSPIMNNWFGMGIGSKIAVVSVATMAAMAMNVHWGMTRLKPFAEDLMKSYACNKREIFFKLRLPNSAPSIVTALKISTTTSMIAAIVSEFFTSQQGIGYEMSTLVKLSRMPLAWSYIFLAAFSGIFLYGLVSLVERYALKWHSSNK
jgi:NitT/TauT family transport system permease protein